MSNIIEIEHLTKSYKDVEAVKDISFHVVEGEFFSLLGVNGAGKSTTISIICGVLQRDGGNVTILGKNLDDNLKEIKSKIGIVFQNSVLDKVLSVKDNLRFRANMYGINGLAFNKRLDELIELFSIGDILDRPIEKLSGGQKRKVDIARALVHNPKLLILDEPTTGLDPMTRRQVWDIINNLRKNQGLSILLTTHYMEEAADSDYIIIMDEGNIKAKGTPVELKNQFTGDVINFYDLTENETKKLPIQGKFLNNNTYRVDIPDIATATELIINYPELFRDYEISKGKMDDVFLAVTGKTLGEGK